MVFQASVLKFREHGQPELRAFALGFAYSQSEQRFFTLSVNGIDRSFTHRA
jgi:hypothetical protein